MAINHIFSLLVLFLGLTGCGSQNDTPSPLILVGGRASLGPISGATVTIFSLNSDGSQGSVLNTTTTDSDGQYTALVLAQSGPVQVVVSGGSYQEEASGLTVNLGTQSISAVAPYLGSHRSLSVSALTHL